MLNYRLISHTLSQVVFIETLMMLVAFIVAFSFGERPWIYLGLPTLGAFLIGMTFFLIGRKAKKKITRRDGYLIVALAWLLLSAIGMVPFIMEGHEPRVACAFFEMMSGFTTTGASAIKDISTLPHSLLLFRSMTHWLGGLGIVFFTIAILPSMGAADLKLFAAESTGISTSKMHPRIKTTARWLWSIYLLLTIACCVSFYLAGMNVFDAINHAFSTIATGGFSTHQESIAYFHSAQIEYVVIIFMFLSGVNFTLIYLFLFKRRLRQIWEDSELRCYFIIVIGAIVSITAIRYFQSDRALEEIFRSTALTVTSLQSTTGFVSEDFMLWPQATWFIILMVTAIGSCSGSTAGGMKCVRIVTAYKLFVNEFQHMLHPRALLPIRLNHQEIGGTVIRTVFAFFIAYFLLVIIGVFIYTSMGQSIPDAIGLGITLLSNAGPAVGQSIGATGTWDMLPDAGVWFGSFLMFAGRLEIFSVILPFIPAFWQDN